MLVLTRHKNETIVIDPSKCPVDQLGRITITVVEFGLGKKVRLGVSAPRGIPIHRGEVQDVIDAKGKPAA